MAATDPRAIIKGIVQAYIVLNPITKDNGVTNSSVLHIYERGPEDIKNLFYDDNYDVVFFYGEPEETGIRKIQDVPVHFLMSYLVTVVTVDKHFPLLGPLVCTATTMQAKARTAIRAAAAGAAQSAVGATPAYTLTVVRGRGKNEWRAGINIWSTPYTLLWTTGGP